MDTSANVVSSAIGGGASLIGSAAAAMFNHRENRLQFERQKELSRLQYENYLKYSRLAGATPTSIVQGLTHTAGAGVPGVSSSGNPAPDFGQSLASGVSSFASQREADAANVEANSNKLISDMKLMFEPWKYFADIRKSLADAFNANKQAFYYGSMSRYYNELTTDVQKVRPWKIAGLVQGLLNDMATYNKIVQETATSKAQEGYFKSASKELETRSDLNTSMSYYYWNKTQNEALEGVRLQFENTLLAAGIDPSRSFWENTLRLAITDPSMFKRRMDMFITSLNDIDGKIKQNLGDNYKRNIVAGVGMYKLNQIIQKNKNSRSYRSANAIQSISKLIPFLNLGSSVPSVGVSGPGVDWWLKD